MKIVRIARMRKSVNVPRSVHNFIAYAPIASTDEITPTLITTYPWFYCAVSGASFFGPAGIVTARRSSAGV